MPIAQFEPIVTIIVVVMYLYGLKKTRSIWLVDVNLPKLWSKQSMIMEIKGHYRITLLIQPLDMAN
jgi:hypothetical protein